MQIGNFKCPNCDLLYESSKKSIFDSWQDVKSVCPKCDTIGEYVYVPITVDVTEGLYGNAKNAYTKGIKGYQYGIMGKLKGVRVR